MTLLFRFRLALLSIVVAGACLGIHLYTGIILPMILSWIFIVFSFGITFGLDAYRGWKDND